MTRPPIDQRNSAELVAQLALPMVVVQEGGYDVDAIGDNVCAFLLGITSRSEQAL